MNPRKYIDQLFISKVRIKALRYFFTTTEPIHLRGAVRELNEEINAVRRELSRMQEIKLLLAETRGNRKYFRVNTDFVFFDELLAIVNKTFGLGGEIVSNTSKLGDVQFAILTQGFTRGKHVGPHAMDLVLIGDNVNMNNVDEIVTKEEKRLGRHINYTCLTLKDFELRKRRKDPFMMELLFQDRVMLIGKTEEFFAAMV